MTGDAEVQEAQESRPRDPLLVQVKDGGEEELAQMLTGLVSAPKILVERSGGHMLALHCSRF